MASPTTNVTFTTDYGAFVVTLLPDAAPKSVANFLYYVENLTAGYNAEGSFFHRLVPGFVLQGGGYGVGTGSGVVIPTQAAVPSEVSASRPNTAGTIAYATVNGDPNSGTDQFYFNLVDNPSLNSSFTVFGSITSGFSVVQAIAALQVVNAGSPLDQLPIDKGASASTFNFARDVVDFRVALSLGVDDATAVSPFAQATLSDTAASETLTITYTAANGALSGGGFTGSAGRYTETGSPAQLTAALRALVFTPTAHEVAPGQVVTTPFTLAITSGSTTRTDSSVSVTATALAASANGPSVTSGFTPVETPNVLRALLTGNDAQNPSSPIYAQAQAARAIGVQLDAGQLTQAQAESALAHVVDGTTSVAVASYAFFTGKTPSLAGLNYLVHSDANATDLNDAYYTKFTTENRYINFAANLALYGDGKAQFASDYGGLDLRAATAKAYQAVFGVAADSAKVSALLDTTVPNGLGGTYTRADYFAQYGGDGVNGQGTKAAMVGFLLSNAVATGAAGYGAADLNYVQALEHGMVPTGATELLNAYGSGVSLVGTPATADPSVTG